MRSYFWIVAGLSVAGDKSVAVVLDLGPTSYANLGADGHILPTVAAGAWSQSRYGNVRWRVALVLGVASVGGVAGGGFLAESLPEHALRRLFAVLLLCGTLAVRFARGRKVAPGSLP